MKQSLYILLALFLLVSCKNVSEGGDQYSPYSSEKTKTDKKKYYDSGSQVYEVKYKADGFKLRTASSDLIWKIKLYGDKIKISDNEENLNPYEIKIRKEDLTAKLVKDEQELANLKFATNIGKHIIKSADGKESRFDTKKFKPHLLVQEIKAMPKDQQDILMDEMVAKGY